MSGHPSPLLHVGYHKTGTTWLQEAVFARPETGFHVAWPDRRVLVDEIVLPNELHWDPDVAATRVEASRIPPPDASPAGDRPVPVLSHERLGGNPHSGGHDSLAIARRLQRLFPDAKVLLVVREQRSMIASWYVQHVREGGVSSLREFLRPIEPGTGRIPRFDPRYFEFDHLARAYRELFGADRVLVLPYEWLRAEPEAFVGRIREFAGCPGPAPRLDLHRRHASMSAAATTLSRWTNRLLVRNVVNPSPLLGGVLEGHRNTAAGRMLDRILPRSIMNLGGAGRRRILDTFAAGRYEQSNARLQACCERDLRSLGYAMAGLVDEPATATRPPRAAASEAPADPAAAAAPPAGVAS
ncbi:MAG: sulfotransferase domain-containing protein [Planctomycetota bacterium]|jgi:hypothetical protein